MDNRHTKISHFECNAPLLFYCYKKMYYSVSSTMPNISHNFHKPHLDLIKSLNTKLCLQLRLLWIKELPRTAPLGLNQSLGFPTGKYFLTVRFGLYEKGWLFWSRWLWCKRQPHSYPVSCTPLSQIKGASHRTQGWAGARKSFLSPSPSPSVCLCASPVCACVHACGTFLLWESHYLGIIPSFQQGFSEFLCDMRASVTLTSIFSRMETTKVWLENQRKKKRRNMRDNKYGKLFQGVLPDMNWKGGVGGMSHLLH